MSASSSTTRRSGRLCVWDYPKRCSSHAKHAKDAKTCKGFLESPSGRIGNILAEAIQYNGRSRLVFAFLAILA